MNTTYHRKMITKYNHKPCKLYTLEGEKQATIEVSATGTNAVIKSNDKSFAIVVNWQTVERKMESDKLFYSC